MSSENWKVASIQIVAGIVASGLLVSAFTIFYNDFYKKPNLLIDVIPNYKDARNLTVEVSNRGAAAATHLMLKVEVPNTITNYTHTYFTSENYSSIKTDNHSFEILMPRLAYGDGSLVKIGMVTNPGSNLTYDNFDVYATYDQGSTRSHDKPDFSQYVFPFNIILSWLYDNLVVYGFPIPVIILVSGSVIIFIFILRKRRKKADELNFITTIKLELLKVRYALKEDDQFFGPIPGINVDEGPNAELGVGKLKKNIKKIKTSDYKHGIGHEWFKRSDEYKTKLLSVADYRRIADFYLIVCKRESVISEKPLQGNDVIKANKDCITLADKALDDTSWNDYR